MPFIHVHCIECDKCAARFSGGENATAWVRSLLGAIEKAEKAGWAFPRSKGLRAGVLCPACKGNQ